LRSLLSIAGRSVGISVELSHRRAKARRQVIGRYYLKKSADRPAWSDLMTALQSHGVKIVARKTGRLCRTVLSDGSRGAAKRAPILLPNNE
jgi:hypothetical protein